MCGLHSINLFLISTITFSSLAVGLVYQLRDIYQEEWRRVKLNATHQLAGEEIHFQIKLVDCKRNDLSGNDIGNSSIHNYLLFGVENDPGLIENDDRCYPLTVHFNGGRLTVGNRLRLLSTPLRGRFAHIQLTMSGDGDGQIALWFLNSPTPKPLQFKMACPIGDENSTIILAMRRQLVSFQDVQSGCEVAVEFKDHSYQQLESWPHNNMRDVISTTTTKEETFVTSAAETPETRRSVTKVQRRVGKRISSIYRVVFELLLVVMSLIILASIGVFVFRCCWTMETWDNPIQSQLQPSSSAPKSSPL